MNIINLLDIGGEMEKIQKNYALRSVIAFIVAGLLFATSSNALELELTPSKAIRENGDKVRVKIFANNATALISMGVKVSFNPAVLQVETAKKNTDFTQGWIMDADGDSGTQNDQYTLPVVEIDNTAGTVIMIGGRITGTSTQGLSGKTLLGWIDFNAIALGASDLSVDLGKYHPQHPDKTYDNFVNLNGGVDEPTNAVTILGKICVTVDTCPTDLNVDGVTDMQDWLAFGEAWGRTDCNAPLLEICECDLNGDGTCDMQDWLKFGETWGRTDCPTCE